MRSLLDPLVQAADQAAAQLLELIDALDRRIPQVERAGERVIAQEASALRALAMARLIELAADAAGPDACVDPESRR